MVKKLKAGGRAKAAAPAVDAKLAKNVMDSAQSIWLAGLGAFSNVQAEGGKVFEQLVEVGKGIEARTRSVAEKTVGVMSETVKTTAGGAVAKAQGQWDKLEQVFEDRVSRSLHRLGVLTNKDIEALTEQVAELSDAVRKLTTDDKPKARAGAAKKAAVKPVAEKTVVSKAPAKKAPAKKAPAKTAPAKTPAKTAAVKKAVAKAEEAVVSNAERATQTAMAAVEAVSEAASDVAKQVANQPVVKRARKMVKDITG
jgi:poly(hydroxyalkanoate) granule-associated protein